MTLNLFTVHCYFHFRFLQKYPEYPKEDEIHDICLDEVAKELSKFRTCKVVILHFGSLEQR